MDARKKQRLDILKELYIALDTKPRLAWVSMYELKKVVGDCDVAIFYT